MKAVTLYEPYASLIAAKLKQYETRHWPIYHRGLMAIHAGKDRRMISALDAYERGEISDLGEFEELVAAFRQEGKLPKVYPLGCVICTVNVKACLRMTPRLITEQSELELAFGDWREGRFAWKLEVVEVFGEPIPARGAQGIWEWVR